MDGVTFRCGFNRQQIWLGMEYWSRWDFKVARTRKWIDNKILPSNDRKTRWRCLISGKFNIHVWRTLIDSNID